MPFKRGPAVKAVIPGEPTPSGGSHYRLCAVCDRLFVNMPRLGGKEGLWTYHCAACKRREMARPEPLLWARP